VLKALESYVDDNGVGKDDLALIVGDTFMRDLAREPSRTLARVSEAISELNGAGLLHRYEVDGNALLFIAFWEQVQRVDKPQPGRMPRPDGTFNYKDSVIRECVANPREPSRTLAPVTEEQRNRGTGEQGNSSPAPAVLASEFDRAWAHWPKKVERKQAAARFATVARRMDVTELVAHIIRFGDAYAETTERQFVPALGAWLNGERWSDELPARRQANNVKQSRADENAADYYRYYGGNDERAGSVPALDSGLG
jgi:hypothetical protein